MTRCIPNYSLRGCICRVRPAAVRAASPRTLRPQELSDLCRQLSTLLASGVSLVRALARSSRQDEGISAGLRRIYESVLGEVRKGSSVLLPHSRRSRCSRRSCSA